MREKSFTFFSFGALIFSLITFTAVAGQDNTPQKSASAIGRWDLIVHGSQGDYPSWLDVRLSGRHTLVGSFVGQFGSARPISRVEVDQRRIRFVVPPQWEQRPADLIFEGKMENDLLHGETIDDQGKRVSWEGRRAPSLKRDKPVQWKQPIDLFNGNDLAGWKPRVAAKKNSWVARDGLLVNSVAGVDLVTERKFTDFKLHAEFRYPKGSNSGIYLRGRYELQIEDSYGQEPDSHGIGGIYGFLTPSVNAAKKPGDWQKVDITLAGRVVTVLLNGERIIDRQTIPGITGGALDSKEGEPGPILLQGDHGPIDFRNLTLTPGE